MNAATQAVHNRLAAVLALAAARLEPARHQVIQQIAPEYFQRLDPQDLAERTPEDLLGALLSHLQLGAQRQPGVPTVRIFSPTPGEDGWSSRHSVIHVVNDDMPFLVDSTTLEINREGYTLHLIVHPIYAVRRDAQGRLLKVSPRDQDPQAPRESWMYVEIDRLADAEQRDALAARIRRVLGDVRAAVEDWKKMVARM
ncbi:MAG TPA: NAD-glutamate dehydrogenase, partial [Ramlibacter sp.]